MQAGQEQALCFEGRAWFGMALPGLHPCHMCFLSILERELSNSHVSAKSDATQQLGSARK